MRRSEQQMAVNTAIATARQLADVCGDELELVQHGQDAPRLLEHTIAGLLVAQVAAQAAREAGHEEARALQVLERWWGLGAPALALSGAGELPEELRALLCLAAFEEEL